MRSQLRWQAAPIGQAQQHRHEDIEPARHDPHPTQPESIGAGHQPGYARHQRTAEQPGHAQHHAARIEDQPLREGERCQHADHTDSPEQAPGKQPTQQWPLDMPHIQGVQPAQRDQQSRALDKFQGHGTTRRG